MQPLAGLRGVDLADEKGELCGRVLADLGAEIIRVEPPGGAPSRRLPPFADDDETSLYFAIRNAGKRSAVIDVTTEKGRERLHGLLADADFFIESFAPGTLAELQLAPEDLIARHPGLIVVSISDFGQTGPYREYVGTDMVGFAMGGLMHRAGRIEKPPLVAPGSLAYDATGVAAAFGALSAFWKRLRTGRGQHIDASVFEAIANLSDWSLPNYSINPGVGPRAGAGIYTLYRCADGFVRMIILPRHHWIKLLDWVGHPEELMDPSYEEFVGRLVAMDKIVPVLEAFFRDKKKIDIAVQAQELGIPATPLLLPAEVLENPHTVGRGTFMPLPVGGGYEAQVPSGFYTVEGVRAGPTCGPPEVGELGDGGFSDGGVERRQIEALLAKAAGADGDGHPFRGLRVMDFGVGAVGVEIGRLFAEYGAEVIKIETREAPDFIRVIMSSYMNASFASSSRSKQSFGVNVKTAKGLELVYKLAAVSDVAIENNGAGVMERIGLDPASLRKHCPHLVSVSSQMVGNYGPWRGWVGYGPNTHPVSGLQHLWNYPEDEDSPAGSTNIYPDHFVGRVGALGVVAGLIQQRRSDEPSHFDVAQFEAAIGLLGDILAKESLSPGSVHPQGNQSLRGVPWSCYRCEGEDEWCVINVRSDEEWQRLSTLLGDPDWATPEMDTLAGRRKHEAELDRHIGEWTATRDPRTVMETLQAERIPCGIVAHPGHHIGDPQLAHRNYPKVVDQQDLTSMLLEGPAFLGSDLPEVIVTQAPRLGEHTREIAKRLLDLDEAEIESLIAEGILEDPPTEYSPGSR
ncbi:MAG: CoA transferase [Myxococcales bacterium]|nr:CoA transferase [Myxococcales bacterium]